MRHRIVRRLLLFVLLLFSATMLAAPAQGIGVLCPGKVCAEMFEPAEWFDSVVYE